MIRLPDPSNLPATDTGARLVSGRMPALVPAGPASHVTGMDTQQTETAAVGTPGDREGGLLGIFDYLDAKHTKLKFA